MSIKNMKKNQLLRIRMKLKEEKNRKQIMRKIEKANNRVKINYKGYNRY